MVDRSDRNDCDLKSTQKPFIEKESDKVKYKIIRNLFSEIR